MHDWIGKHFSLSHRPRKHTIETWGRKETDRCNYYVYIQHVARQPVVTSEQVGGDIIGAAGSLGVGPVTERLLD